MNITSITVPTKEIENLVRKTAAPNETDAPLPSWPMAESFSVTPDQPVAYDDTELHTVTVSPSGASGDTRNVLLVMFDGEREAHRIMTFDAGTAQASAADGVNGPVTEQQMQRDARFTTALLRLLTDEDAQIIQTHQQPQANTSPGPQVHRLRWERRRRQDAVG